MSTDRARREFLATATAIASLALLPPAIRAAAAETRWARYAGAVVIDSCGSPGRTSNGPAHTPLDAGELADIRNSGVTALNLTVSSVGSYANDFNETIDNIAYWDSQIAAHPDALMKVDARRAAQ